jgi:hypothetical protein
MWSHTRAAYMRGVDFACISLPELNAGAMTFDPRPDEHQRFKLPDSLLEE